MSWMAEVISRSFRPHTARCRSTHESKSARAAARRIRMASPIETKCTPSPIESRAPMAETKGTAPPSLVRGLGPWDGTLITIGSVLGSAIFIAAADVARAVPHAGLLLVLWVLGGLLTMAGALTYAELSAMFPKAGGQYHFLKEAYGPFWGFLFGWASFTNIMSGGLAALAAGFGAYLGSFVPFFATENVLFVLPLGRWRWATNGSQAAGGLALAFLTAVNYVG